MTAFELTQTTARYAVYFAPGPEDRWWEAGSKWLGRCARTGMAMDQPAVTGIEPVQLAELTQAPRRYGWHATLKAPFSLATGCALADLQHQLNRIACQHSSFLLPPLRVEHMDTFLALVLDGDDSAVQHMGAMCVTALHSLAAPLPDSEVVRRRGAGLTARQEELLQAWGYPHVLDQFRFHMSLTGSLRALSPAQRESLRQGAVSHFQSLQPLRFEALDLFVEISPGSPFRWVSRHPLKVCDE